MHVVMLGGGACGMSAALELTRLGARATVLEREPRVGGLCGTHERDGYRFDFGGHRFITSSPEIDGLVRDLMGDELLERRRSSVVINGGHRYRYPLELDDVVKSYGLQRGARAVGSYLREVARRRLRPRPDRSFRDWVTHRFGSEIYGTFFGPYTEKLWGIPPEAISADWAAERISLPSLGDVALRLLGVPRKAARTYARRYLYPRLGIGQIFERCAEAIVARGGEVHTGCEVTGIEVHRSGVRAVRFRDADGERELACDAVISTLGLPTLARFVGVRPRQQRSADRLRFRAIRLLNLQLEGPPVSPHTWMYVSEPGYLMARIQEPIHRSPAMAPSGATSLMLEIPCEMGDATWTAPDDEIYERCLDDLGRLGIDGIDGIRGRTRGYFSSYVPEGYPIYHLDYADDRRRVLDHVGKVPGLVSCGRQGGFRYIFMDTAMEMGIEAARTVLHPHRASAVADLGVGSQRLLEAQALTA